MEIITLALFCTVLTLCVIFDVSVLYALAAGLIIFCLYAKLRKFTFRRIGTMVLSGMKTIKNILIILLLIGVLTGLWRSCGTIAVIINFAVKFITPATFIIMTFLLNCGVSLLLGTAFGTAATMGVICMTMANAMQANPVLTGGAILAGVFFGDRCSPVSTSALLISELTSTDIYSNIKSMLKTAAVPFSLSCIIYIIAGVMCSSSGNIASDNIFADEFVLSPVCIIPAAVIIVLSLFKVKVKITMAVSILAAAIISITVQHTGITEIFSIMFSGFSARNESVALMLNGGGAVSMLRVTAIILISSAYSGIFKDTGLLEPLKKGIIKLSRVITPFGAILVTSVLAAMISCNQAFAIMLTNQLCENINEDKKQTAIDLENSVVTIAPMVPWSIAGAVPLSTVGAPALSISAAFFLYLLPLYTFLRSLIKKNR